MIRLAVNGALGRMGRRILSLAYASSDFKICAGFEQDRSAELGKELGGALGFNEPLKVRVSKLSAEALKGADVLIDFSSPEGVLKSIHACRGSKTALVVGTTGLNTGQEASLKKLAATVPVLYSPNMSLGANFLFELARIAAGQLGSGYDIEIIEAHHRLKKDAPSGTAKKLAEVIAKEKGWNLKKVGTYGREGFTGERKPDELGIHVVRAGDIVGEHTVLFGGPGETIEIKHTALSRDAFARGSLVAALFVAKRSKGFYSMADVLKKQ